MRTIALLAAVSCFVVWNGSTHAGDYVLRGGVRVAWNWPAWVLWGAAGSPHAGHWFAIGHPQQIFHPYPWFLVYPTGVHWPTTPGWMQYTLPAPSVTGWTYTNPAAGWSGYPGFATEQNPMVAPAHPGLAGNANGLPSWPASAVPGPDWPAGQNVPYYWFGR